MDQTGASSLTSPRSRGSSCSSSQHEGVQGAENYGQKERIRWKQQNSKQDCVKDQAGQQEVERD